MNEDEATSFWTVLEEKIKRLEAILALHHFIDDYHVDERQMRRLDKAQNRLESWEVGPRGFSYLKVSIRLAEYCAHFDLQRTEDYWLQVSRQHRIRFGISEKDRDVLYHHHGRFDESRE